MSKLSGESLNITEQNLAKLHQLFPEAFTEGKIDFDVLKQLLGDFVDDDEERYRFKWNGKGRALRLSQTPSLGTLRPCKEESKDWDNTQNLYIEGDNLEVLKLLQKSYYGKVKMIYIDPPYNTGGDFVYKDDFRDNIENYKRVTGQVDDEGRPVSPNTESNGRFHTDWLNMMYPRLRLAKNLLSEDGVIFISIDDNEQVNLKKICDEIFGGNNFIADAVLQRSSNGMGDKKGFALCHEYALCYQKSDLTTFKGLSPDSDYKKQFDQEDEYGKFKIDGILMKKGAGSRRIDSPTLFFPLYYSPSTGKVSLEKIEGYKERFPIKSNGSDGRWIWGKDKITNESYRLYASPNGTIYVKDYLNKDRRMKIKSILHHSEYITDRATNEIKDLFREVQDKVFDTPKPIKLLLDLCDLTTSTDDIILDFFSGSATTAHAVMQLNAKDGGHRKFIMVQIPERTDKDKEAYKAGYTTIAEIGKERIRRAGEKILAEMAQTSQSEEGLLIERERERERELAHSARGLDVGFKVFKLDSSNLRKWNPQPEDLQIALQESVENFLPGRKELDVVYEILLKKGYEITVPIAERDAAGKQVYVIGDGSLMVCLGDNITVAVADEIVKLHREYGTKDWSVVFQDNGFASDMDKTNIKETLKTAGLDESCFECL